MFNWLKRNEFSWLNSQGVLSRKGFSLQFTDRFSAEYREGDHRLTFEVEHGFLEGGKPCVLVCPDNLSRWDDSDRDIAPDKRANILANIERAIRFQGLGFEVVEPLSYFDSLIQSRDSYVQILEAGKTLSINGVKIPDIAALDAFIAGHRET